MSLEYLSGKETGNLLRLTTTINFWHNNIYNNNIRLCYLPMKEYCPIFNTSQLSEKGKAF